jgi:CRP/FNR family transcriptional regulator, cyclic AMP receptor protein
VRIAVRLSQAEWGSLVGASRESVNHQLGIWREQGLVRLEAGQLVILRLNALERLAEHGAL